MTELSSVDDAVLAQIHLYGVRLALGDLLAIANLLGNSTNRWTVSNHYLSPVAPRNSRASAATNIAYITSRNSLTEIFEAAPRGMLPFLELNSSQDKGAIRLVVGGRTSPSMHTTLTYSGEGIDLPLEYRRVANYFMANKRTRGANRWFFSMAAFLIPLVYAVAVAKFAASFVASLNFVDTLFFLFIGSSLFFVLWLMAFAIFSSNAAAGARLKPVVRKREAKRRLLQMTKSGWNAARATNGSVVAATFGVLSFIVALLAWLAPMK